MKKALRFDRKFVIILTFAFSPIPAPSRRKAGGLVWNVKGRGLFMATVQLNMNHAVAIAAMLYWLGNRLIHRIPPLANYCIPAPLVGGLCFALLNTLLYATGTAHISFDSTLKDVFMIMFFTTVGFTVSLPLLLRGGKAVFLVLLLAVAATVMQNVLGVGTLTLLGRDPRLGLAAGSISMVGGPGTAATFGPMLERMGVAGAEVVSVAAATFGLVMGSVLGGPLARRRIEQYKLHSTAPAGAADDAEESHGAFMTNSPALVKGFMLIMLCLGLGSVISALLDDKTPLTFPAYIGAMLAAVVVRNVMEGFKVPFPGAEVEVVGNMSLSLFLAMAMMDLKLWELVDLALPMVIALAVQVAFMAGFAYFVVFRVMGRNYDAAVTVSGFTGFAMGATSNAMANMQAVTRRYGPSPTAYFAIPMVGGMFVDFLNSVIIAGAANLLTSLPAG